MIQYLYRFALSLFLLCLPALAFSRQTPSSSAPVVTVKGRVTDKANGQGLPGVNVTVKNTSTGTITDADGDYTLKTPGDGTLVFSFIGYISQTVAVGDKTVINTVLAEDVESLKEIVVIGYGTQERRDLTSSVSSVTAKEIEKLPVTGLDQALQGRAAGVEVVNNSGAPGSGVQVRIRGNTSLSGSNEPLYVVDGVTINNTQSGYGAAGGDKLNGMAGINPADIESIDVLKDAAATSIYGARGGNGVVIITTKKGKAGIPKISFNTYYGVQNVVRKLDVLNSTEFADLINELEIRRGNNPIFQLLPTISTNWQDEIFRQASQYSANVSVSGGTDKSRYLISGGYFKQEGTLINTQFDRLNFRINLENDLSNRVKVGTNVMLSNANNNRSRNDGTIDNVFDRNFAPSVIATALTFSPAIPVRNPNGSFGLDTVTRNISSNPVALATLPIIRANIFRIIGNVFAEVKLREDLTFRTNWGTDIRYDRENYFLPPNALNPINAGSFNSGNANVSTLQEVFWQTENYLTYKKTINEVHNFTALAGFSLQENNTATTSASSQNFASPLVTVVSAGSLITGINEFRTSWGFSSYFTRFNYDYRGRYLVQFTVRTDGSSRFGNNKKYGFFPSGSVGWRVSDEKFMKGITLISDLKLRASWGITGNAEFGDNFGSRSTIGYGPLYLGIGNAVGVTPIRLANNDLRWERTIQNNYGLDFSALNGRISFTADYYVKDTRDLLLFVSLPATTGFGGTFQNIGRMRNSGIEFSLRSENIVGSGLTWNTQFNIGFNRNKIVALASNNDIRAGTNVARIGNPISFIVFDLGNPIVSPQTGLLQNPGDSPNRSEILGGSPFPKFTGGLTNNFAYKGFDLSVFLQFVYGNKIYNGTRSSIEDMRGFYNGSKRLLGRWKNPGDITDIPVASLAPEVVRTNSGFNSVRYLEDGSFLRVKNVTLGYNVPAKLSKKISIERMRIYASGQNLFVFTKYLGFDPEVNAVTGNDLFSNIARGLDNGTYPQARTIVMGINVDF